jgi:hypothetical protein
MNLAFRPKLFETLKDYSRADFTADDALVRARELLNSPAPHA